MTRKLKCDAEMEDKSEDDEEEEEEEKGIRDKRRKQMTDEDEGEEEEEEGDDAYLSALIFRYLSAEDKEDGGEGGDRESDEGDETLECRDCSVKFVFTVVEQDFFEKKGFDKKPTRCGECRRRRRRRKRVEEEEEEEEEKEESGGKDALVKIGRRKNVREDEEVYVFVCEFRV